MRKIKALLLAVVICILTVSSYSMQEKVLAKEESQTAELKADILLGFENVRDTLSSVRIEGIDKAELCDVNDYVTQGKKSLHICPREMEEGKDALVVLYPTKKAFLDVEYVSIDVYNSLEKDQKAIFGFMDVWKEYSLNPGKNTLWLNVDRTRLQYSYQGEIKDFFLELENGGQGAENVDVYIDNFQCYYSETSYETYEDHFKENIWYPFEEDAELYNITSHGTIKSDFSQPMFSINKDLRMIKSGTGSLKVEFRNTNSGVQDLRMFRFRDGKLGDLNQYLENADNYYISFPIYNPNSYEITCLATITSNYQYESMDVETVIKPGCWSDNDFVFSLKELEESLTGTGLDILTIVFTVGGMPEGGTIYMDSIGVYAAE